MFVPQRRVLADFVEKPVNWPLAEKWLCRRFRLL